MAYATQSDIETLYGADALAVADRDGDGVADAATVSRALEAASAEIDSYVGVRHDLPLEGAHPVLTQYCVDIALYRLSVAATYVTEEGRQRYEDAIAALKRIAKGEQHLAIPADPESDEADFESPSPIVSGGPERAFSREKTRGL
ncbi:MAG TPA: DUF1320 domain-containing protein [Roseovarius sp.]|jgi:phage gp36-like protein|nr:DUF1320 domain-containing protein [Roseovarius sp.]